MCPQDTPKQRLLWPNFRNALSCSFLLKILRSSEQKNLLDFDVKLIWSQDLCVCVCIYLCVCACTRVLTCMFPSNNSFWNWYAEATLGKSVYPSLSLQRKKMHTILTVMESSQPCYWQDWNLTLVSRQLGSFLITLKKSSDVSPGTSFSLSGVWGCIYL